MVRLYIDLETYRPRREDAFIDERIISAGILLDNTPYHDSSLHDEIEPILFNEWDDHTERQIVSEVEKLIKDTVNRYRFTVVCGYNILRFDIPLIVCKSIQDAPSNSNRLSKMWYDCFIIDFMQQILLMNGNYFRGTGLGNVVSVSKQIGLNPPNYTSSGASIKGLYDEGNYKEIEGHLVQDLNIIRWLDLYGSRRLMEISVHENRPLFRD